MNLQRMIAVIQCYIHHKKGVEVIISPKMPSDLPKIMMAYGIANDYFNK